MNTMQSNHEQDAFKPWISTKHIQIADTLTFILSVQDGYMSRLLIPFSDNMFLMVSIYTNVLVDYRWTGLAWKTK